MHAASAAPPTAMSAPDSSFSARTSSTGSPRDRRVLPSTVSRVFEKTTFGSSFQIRANSASGSSTEGSRSSTVSQYAMTS
jgi:hypothetical protein